MIYIFQDKSKIPEKWLTKVEALQVKLEAAKDVAARKKIVTDNDVWGDIKDQLLEMSHGKCWYSEADDAVSDWHVDHYRPKGQAIGLYGVIREGYAWLAFDWKNYRVAGSYPNSPHKDKGGVIKGKWDSFPLFDDNKAASWNARDCKDEVCLILDPTIKSDPPLIRFKADGMPEASANDAVTKLRVKKSIHFLNLDCPRLVEARRKAWRDTHDLIEELIEAAPENEDDLRPDDFRRIERITNKIGKRTEPSQPYASAVRSCLTKNGYGQLIRSIEFAAA